MHNDPIKVKYLYNHCRQELTKISWLLITGIRILWAKALSHQQSVVSRPPEGLNRSRKMPYISKCWRFPAKACGSNKEKRPPWGTLYGTRHNSLNSRHSFKSLNVVYYSGKCDDVTAVSDLLEICLWAKKCFQAVIRKVWLMCRLTLRHTSL